MKPILQPHAAFTAICLAVLLAFPAGVGATPPDLTAAGAIAALKTDTSASPVYGLTYNLGATGLRGWIYISSGNMGPDDIITGESRQILVTVASTPGSAVLAVDDVILGAMAGTSGTVPLFTSDSRKAFGAAIGDAESAGAGTLRVKRWRAGITTDVNIAMTLMGNYTDTAPYSCPKSALILANARTSLVSQLLADPNFLTNDYGGAIKGLALLAGVAPGDANYATVQTRLQTFARALAATTPVPSGLYVWNWGYIGVFLSEYYLNTSDATVVAGIHTYTVALAKVQSRYGTYGHGGSLLNADGSLHGTIQPYGPVNQAGLPANIAIVMGKQALLAASQVIDPEIDPAILRGGNFFAWYVNKGPIPYGEHEPFMAGHSPNGKDALCAVLFGLQANRTAETEYFARMTTAGFNGREYGHTGQGFSYLWGAMGANMGGALAVAQYLKPVRWHLDLERRTDGSFVYDGGEQFGAGSTADGTYLGKSGYYDINPTASYILTYSLPLQRLHITGKNAIPANTLDSTKVADAIAAATFDLDCHGFTTTQLITALSAFDPVVRNYAAIELATRTLSSAELTTLRGMIGDTANANGRQGACQTLGILKDATALPLITQRLDKTIEPDSWVRAKAASALRSYTSATTSTQRDPMLTAFTANATDPDVIVWDDPIQISNGYLGFALFGDAVYGGTNIATYTINAAKSLLYPAVRAGLKQPDSKSRLGVANFCYNYLTLADVQALIPDLFEVIETESQADTMWSMDPRGKGIATLAKYKIAEGIPEALDLLVVPTGFGWGCDGFQIPGLNALAAYGDAARWTLPTLRAYLGTWDPLSSQYTTLVNTLASIEAAITSPTKNLGLAVANPQVVATTGAKAITLTGTSPRNAVTFANVTAPAHGTLTGTAPNLTYTPAGGYTGPDSFTFQVTDGLTTSAPGTVSIVVGSAGTGLKGEYYDNMDFTNLKVTRTDAQVNFDWGTGSPDPSIGADTFSVRWSGLLLVPETGTYTFSTLNSDGVRLYINGVPVIDDYADQTTNWKDGVSVNLTADQMADLQMEYYENTGSAVAKLKWTGPSFAGANGAIIGTQWLYDGTGVTNRTAYAHAQSLALIQNTAQPITLTGSGGTLTYTVINPPAHGVLTGIAPYLTYTPATNYSGSDSFTFLVNNGTSNSSPATVSISVWAGLPVTYTWDSATSGNWSVAGNWASGAPAAAGQPYYILNFTPSGTFTVTADLNNGFLLNQLNMGGAVTIAGTNSLTFAANGALLPQFNQNSSSSVTVNTPLSLAAMTQFGGTSGGNVTINSLISGTGGLTRNNPGVLTINNINNTYSGGTVLNAGTVGFVAGAGSITPFFGTGPVTINPDATLQVNRTSLTNPIFLNGATVTGGNSFSSTLSGPVTLSGITTFDFGTTGGFSITGNMSGTGGLTTVGTTLWHLSGTNSHTGPTSIQAGTLSYDTAAAVGPGALDISSGAIAKLNYTGTRTIASLTLGGALMPAGTYGSSSSPAANRNNTYFSGTGTVTILPATATTLALTGGATPADPGTPLTFTATVTGNTPTGNVAFYAGAALLGTSNLNGSYQAGFTTSSLAIGSSNITAQYAGNATNAASVSAPLVIVITSELAAQPSNLLATPGDNYVTLTWNVSAGAASYYVKRSLSNGGPYTVIGNPGTGNYTDLATVNGSSYYYVVSAINAVGESANSSQVGVMAGVLPSLTTLVSSPVATGPYGTAVTFTATVSVSGGPATGTVTFWDGATVLGSGTLSAGTATFATSTLAVANHSISATYAGDITYVGSSSAPSVYAVTVKGLTLTGVTAANKVYDGGNTAVLTGGALSGVISGETVTVVPGSAIFTSTNAGTWAVTATGYALGGANAGNYALTQPGGLTGTITAADLTVTADNQSKTYGQTLAFGSGATRFTSSGLQNGETIGTVTLACVGGDPAAAVATYPITPGTATGGTFNAGNYSISYVPGTLTVNQTGQMITKAATGTDLIAGASWTGSTAPGSGDVATWAGTSLGASLTLGSSTSWGGIGVASALTAIGVTGAGPLTLGSGGIDMSSAAVDLTLGTPIALGASQTWNANSGRTLTASGIISGSSMGLTKAGLGTLTLKGANTYSGTTTIFGGTLVADTASAATILNSSSPLAFTSSGTFQLKGLSAQTRSQIVNGLTLTSGAAIIDANNTGTSTTIDLGGLGGTLTITRSAGATVDFKATAGTFATTAVVKTAQANDSTGMLGAWATVNSGADWAINNGSNVAAPYTGYNTLSGTMLATGGTVNYRVATSPTTPTGNITLAATGTIDINTLRINDTAARTIDVRNGTTQGILRFSALGGLLTSGGSHIIGVSGTGTAGTITAGGADNTAGEFVVNNSAALAINSVIANNGTGAITLTKSGSGTLTLNVGNTHSGGTIINSGTLNMGNRYVNPLGSGMITVNSGASFGPNSPSATLTNAITLNGGTITNGNSYGSTASGLITLGTTSTFDTGTTGNMTFSNNVSGPGGVIKTGASGVPVKFNGTNTYTGPTIINAGIVQFKSSLYSNDTAQWTPANITVASGAMLMVNVGGASDFTIAQANTLFSSLSTVNNNGLKAGALIGFDTTNAGAATVTISANLADSTGPGGGAMGVKNLGTGTFELTGTNTYSGPTITDNNGTLKVSSINSVATNASLGTVHSASSSLGAPTTSANATIGLGTSGTYQGGNLTYTGTGETTDRVINMGGANGTTYRFDQSGTGLLKFISAFTITDNRGPKTIVLQGSTAGTGEIASVIPLGQATGTPNNLTKSGTGTWTLSAANANAGGLFTASGGALVLSNATAIPGGIGVSGGTSPLTFNGGVIGLGAGDFTRSLAAAGVVTGVNFTGNGGWAAYGANRAVNLGGASATIAWAPANTGLNAKTLIFGNATATHTVDFQNPLDLGAATRTVQVDKGAAAIDGKLSGSLTNGNLTKTGLGTLALTGSNSYAGATTVSAGTLLVNGTNSGTGLITVASGAILGGTGGIAGPATFSTGGKAVFTVTRDPVTQANTTPLTIAGVMAYNTTEVHLNLPPGLPLGIYTLATSSATPTGTVTATPVVDSGSYADGFTSAVVSLDTATKRLLLTVTGLPTKPTKLTITAVNGGLSPTAGTGFSIVVQAQDANGDSRQVLANTAVTLSLNTGSGPLGGTLVSTIPAGNTAVTISGVTYGTAESGVTLTATATSGDSLSAANSAPFTVLPSTAPAYLLVTGFPSPQTAGFPGSVTVTCKTSSGTTATTYTGTVHFTSTSVLAGLPGDYTFVSGDNGVHSFSGVMLNTTGMQSITATDTVTSSITGTQSAITVWNPPTNFTWRSGVNGAWSDATKWVQYGGLDFAPLAAGQSDYTLNFIAGSYTATQNLNNGFLVNQLNFAGATTVDGTNAVALTNNGGILPTVNQNSAGGVIINHPVSLAANVSVAGSGSGQVDLAGLISGTGSLTKNTTGVLKIYGLVPNPYSGGTVISSGTLWVGTMVNGISPLCTGVLGTGPVTLGSGTTIQFDNVAEANALISNGGTIYSQNGWGATWTGPITLNANTTFNATFNLACSGGVSGTGGVIKTGGATLTLSGTLNYTGNTTATAGILSINSAYLADDSTVTIANGAKIDLNTAGASDAIGVLVLGGVSVPPGVYNSTHPTYGSYFTGSGSLVVGTAYDQWAGTNGLTGPAAAADADPDHDGLANGLEFVLGGQPNPALANSDSVALLPKVSDVSGDLVFTFHRKVVSNTAATVTFQWSTDLTFPAINDVPVGTTSSSGTPGVDVRVAVTSGVPDAATDTVIITVPAVKAAGGKVFGRLHVAVP